tara:strand:- start:922 stop:1101 length:180 start_codon:yes stop_codon:yes gene_type:complete
MVHTKRSKIDYVINSFIQSIKENPDDYAHEILYKLGNFKQIDDETLDGMVDELQKANPS